MPACVLCLMLTRDQQRRQRLGDPRDLEPAGVDRAQARRSAPISSIAAAFGSLRSPQTSTSSSSACVEVGELRGADGVQRADDVDALRDELGGLLRGGALRHAEHARRLAADRGRERDGRVDHELAGPQVLGDRLVGRGLAGERDGHDDDLGRRRGGLGVRRRPRRSPPGTAARTRCGRLRGAARVARADRRPATRRAAQRTASPKPRSPVAPMIETPRRAPAWPCGGGVYGCPLMRLEGRTALVTGGASGIGAATTRRLAAEGARVAIGDVQLDLAREVAGEVDGLAVELDVDRRRLGRTRRSRRSPASSARSTCSSTTPAPTASRSSSTPTRSSGTSSSA